MKNGRGNGRSSRPNCRRTPGVDAHSAQSSTTAVAASPQAGGLHPNTIGRRLHNQLIVLKTMETVAEDRNRHDVKMARAAHVEWYTLPVNSNHPPEMVFVDESGFNLWLSRTRGRAHRGERAVRVVNGQRGQNFTLILAVSTEGVRHIDFYEGEVTADRFNTWLEAASIAAGEGRKVFIMDNAPCHRRADQANLLEGHSIRKLPAYSPFLNIAENAFSMWKAGFKREMAEVREDFHQQPAAERSATMLQLAQQNLASITANKIARSTRKMAGVMPRLIHREDILQDHA